MLLIFTIAPILVAALLNIRAKHPLQKFIMTLLNFEHLTSYERSSKAMEERRILNNGIFVGTENIP